MRLLVSPLLLAATTAAAVNATDRVPARLSVGTHDRAISGRAPASRTNVTTHSGSSRERGVGHKPAVCVLPLPIRGCSADERDGFAMWQAVVLVCVATFALPVCVALLLIARDRLRAALSGWRRVPSSEEMAASPERLPAAQPLPKFNFDESGFVSD